MILHNWCVLSEDKCQVVRLRESPTGLAGLWAQVCSICCLVHTHPLTRTDYNLLSVTQHWQALTIIVTVLHGHPINTLCVCWCVCVCVCVCVDVWMCVFMCVVEELWFPVKRWWVQLNCLCRRRSRQGLHRCFCHHRRRRHCASQPPSPSAWLHSPAFQNKSLLFASMSLDSCGQNHAQVLFFPSPLCGRAPLCGGCCVMLTSPFFCSVSLPLQRQALGAHMPRTEGQS